MSALFLLLQRLVPQHALSRVLGRLARARGPRWLKDAVIRRFVAHYHVDLDEAQQPLAEAYG
ncbi:MAG: phosphatidylserine decarboxylase, partial [Pseudomonadota bacterium]